MQQRRVDVAEPQSIISLHLNPACLSDGFANEPLELRNKLVCVDGFGIQYLPSREGEKLRR
jgi:hypothetical protein